jgi:hypothetical protein
MIERRINQMPPVLFAGLVLLGAFMGNGRSVPAADTDIRRNEALHSLLVHVWSGAAVEGPMSSGHFEIHYGLRLFIRFSFLLSCADS